MMIPVHVIVFFLALVLLPADVRQFTVDLNGKSLQWTRQAGAWQAVQLPRDDWGTYTRSNTVVVVAEKGRELKVNVADFLEVAPAAEGATVTAFATTRAAFGSPVRVAREPHRITLSQEKPGLLRGPAILTWPVAE